MKYFYLLCCLLGLLPATHAQKHKVSVPAETAVRATVDACIQSWNNHDYTDLPTYTTSDVDWVTNVGMWWEGREAVRQALQTFHEGMFQNTPLRSEDMKVRFVTPEVATVHQVVFIGRYFPPDGVDHEYNRQGDNQAMITYILVKEKDKWLISSAQVTDINPAAASYNPVKQYGQAAAKPSRKLK